VLDPLDRQRRLPSAVNFRGANLNTLSPADSEVRVFLLVRSRFFREILVRLLRKQTDIAVVGSSHECSAAFKQLVIRPCDVLLLDSVQMLGSLVRMTGADDRLKKIKVLLLGVEQDPRRFLRATQIGGRGYLLIDASSTEMIAAVRWLATGERARPPCFCKSLSGHVPVERLIRRSERVKRPALQRMN
jgi:DNA-binding NarL/FixJ family response regulator